MSIASNPQSSDPLEAFRELCSRYADLVSAEGVAIQAFDVNKPGILLNQSNEIQQKALKAITTDIEIFESMRSEGVPLRDSKTHIWRFLNQMKWIPLSDVFDKIEKDDVVEIYLLDSSGQTQLFRNLRFLECVSFTIEQLYGLDWKIATDHDARYEKDIVDAIRKILSQEQPSTVAFPPEPHSLREINSPKRFRLHTKLKYLSPLRQNNQTVAMLATNQCVVVE